MERWRLFQTLQKFFQNFLSVCQARPSHILYEAIAMKGEPYGSTLPLRPAASALRLRRPSAGDRGANAAFPPRQALSNLYRQPEQAPGDAPGGPGLAPGALSTGVAPPAGGHPPGRAEQRRGRTTTTFISRPWPPAPPPLPWAPWRTPRPGTSGTWRA